MMEIEIYHQANATAFSLQIRTNEQMLEVGAESMVKKRKKEKVFT